MQKKIKLWREAASLLLVAKNNFVRNEKFNYKVLTIQRMKTMKFMPNLHTFPGGVLEQTDCSKDWLNLYESFGYNKHYFKKLIGDYQAPIFRSSDKSELEKFMALRICAIRETFEECGVLLCKSGLEDGHNKETNWASYIAGPEISEWQSIVQNDSSQFIEMCHKLKIYPDICSLHEWSNWVTPFSLPQQFDTAFFLAAFQNIPPSSPAKNEVQDLEWQDPIECLKKNDNKNILLAPPQFYEIAKISNHKDIGNLLTHASKNAYNGCKQILPYRIIVDDTNITILPGDDMYPTREYLERREIDKFDSLPDSKIKHRMIHPDPYINEIVIENLKLENELLPNTQYKENSKL